MFEKLMEDERAAIHRELSTTALVDDVDEFPDLARLTVDGRCWKRIAPVVVLVVDLKNSTKLGMGKNVNTTVRIYRSATTRGVGIMDRFEPDFSEVQGDGFFGIFHGSLAYQRAMAAAMTLAHFSRYTLEPGVLNFLGTDCPPTGLKIGVADGTVAVSHLGVPGASNYVWAGKPVNWAFKCSTVADRHQVIVTQSVYDKVVHGNDHLTMPCYIAGHHHSGVLSALWTTAWVKSIGEWCMLRKDPWCRDAGQESCGALMTGQVRRDVSLWERVNYRIS
jgi:class 3 adenylate cyclase